jgi:hypothetical protein
MLEIFFGRDPKIFSVHGLIFQQESIGVDGIVKDPDSIRSGDPYSESGTGYRSAKVTQKIR